MANNDTELDQLSDSFYEQQLRSDGWHLDEVEDDDDLDFAIPTPRAPQRTGCASRFSSCCPCLRLCGLD